MNKKLFFLPMLLLSALVVLTPSCADDDPCKDVECGANGTCFEGECLCDVGFEGTACDTEWATKFLGSYLGSDVCPSGTYNLQTPAVITAISESKISISNFGGFGSFVEATISLENASATTAEVLTINFTDPASRDFDGTAKISGNTITGSYRVTFDDNSFEDCTFTYTK